MPASDDSSGRTSTNSALQSERKQTDDAFALRQQTIEKDADAVVERARETADAVLAEARDEADERTQAGTPDAARAAIAEERDLQDSAVRAERDTADAALTREREETARMLLALLPLERETTDRHLLTERERSDDALANRDDFLGIVSHDLRGLLGGIVMSAGLLSAKAPQNADGDEARTQAERIQRYAARMNRLIGDLVDVASIESGKLAVRRTQEDVARLLDEAAERFEVAAAARDIALDVVVAERPLAAAFDYDRMLQVVANLISNAMKFTSAGGRIVIEADCREGQLRLSVRDTGKGIPSHLLEAIFERFWQVTANDRRGLGLGLYISRSIVEAHGGKIWAESTEGAGTTLHVELPAA